MLFLIFKNLGHGGGWKATINIEGGLEKRGIFDKILDVIFSLGGHVMGIYLGGRMLLSGLDKEEWNCLDGDWIVR